LTRAQRLHYRPMMMIEEPGTLDGGDVLTIGRQAFVGASRRTNAAGIDQLRTMLDHVGYEVRVVPVHRCLHLKSAVTAIGPDAVLINRDGIAADAFAGLEL